MRQRCGSFALYYLLQDYMRTVTGSHQSKLELLNYISQNIYVQEKTTVGTVWHTYSWHSMATLAEYSIKLT